MSLTTRIMAGTGGIGGPGSGTGLAIGPYPFAYPTTEQPAVKESQILIEELKANMILGVICEKSDEELVKTYASFYRRIKEALKKELKR